MSEPWLEAQFEQHRTHLRAVAHRMLGSLDEADDALQESWLRIRGREVDTVNDVAAWLTTVVGRVCLNMLRARRSRRELPIDDAAPAWQVIWTDEDAADPAAEMALADAVRPALLLALDALTPAERFAFVLHDVFGVRFAEIAHALERSEAAAQQLASRARRRVRHASPGERTDRARERAVVDAFFAASRDGDFTALLAILHPDVALRIDGGSVRAAASAVRRGADAVLAETTTYAPLFPYVRSALVDGTSGAVVMVHGRWYAVLAFTVADGLITAIDVLLDPDRLARLSGR